VSVPATTFRAVDDVDQLLDQVCRRGRELKRLRAGLDEIRYPRHDWFETFKTISASPAVENPRELPSWHSLEQGDVPTAEGGGISERVSADAAQARQHAAAHFLKSEQWESEYAAPLLAVVERLQSRAHRSSATKVGLSFGAIALSALTAPMFQKRGPVGRRLGLDEDWAILLTFLWILVVGGGGMVLLRTSSHIGNTSYRAHG
jgi:DNA phosphorothioation-dependent restriction protein DptG